MVSSKPAHFFLKRNIFFILQGDSGGPLVCAGKIEGVCSYGLSCGVRGIPGVYVSIGAHLNWIRSIMRDINQSGNSSTRQMPLSLCSLNNTYTN